MLTVTSHAASRLNRMLHDSTDDDQKVIRMIREKGRFKLRVDRVRDGDVTFRFEDKVVLTLQSQVADKIATRTLGVRTVAGKPRLRFSHQ
jgi:hypothetical protein